jgi:hypothetical protein
MLVRVQRDFFTTPAAGLRNHRYVFNRGTFLECGELSPLLLFNSAILSNDVEKQSGFYLICRRSRLNKRTAC